MKHSWFETIAGMVALACAVGFFLYATGGETEEGEQTFTAHFSSSRGIVRGSEVRLNGVVVGKVMRVHVDPAVFEAVITLSVSDHLRLPFDSTLVAQSPLLLGEAFLGVIPGKETTALQNGDRIVSTRSEPTFEEILERAVFVVGQQAR